MKRQMRVKYGLALCCLLPGSLFANEFEDRIGMPTDSENKTMFTRNVSMIKAGQTVINVNQVEGTRTIKVIGSPNTGNAQHLKYDVKEKDQSIGFLLPLGGASFGADSTLTTKDVNTKVDQSTQPRKETLRDRYWRMHFLLDLTKETQACFSYRYLQTENDILGSFSVNGQDRTDYLGELSGYMANFYSRYKEFGWGAYYAPGLRGKSEIEGEQKILTTPGATGLNLVYTGGGRYSLGLEATRWFYKKDDRDSLSTSPIDQRSISLGGLDLEQRLKNTQRISVGFDVPFTSELKLRGSLYKQDAVWLFREDAVPGDDRRAEKALTYKGAKLALNFDTKQYYLQIGLVRAQRELGSFTDTRSNGSWFGARDYGSYTAEEAYTYISFGFEN